LCHQTPLADNAAAQVVFDLPKGFHVSPLLLPVAACIKINTLLMAYETVNGSTQQYLQNLITRYTPTRLLRSSMHKRSTMKSTNVFSSGFGVVV
ncbi:hypothetical protein Z043_114151, partial [Scleropages formosus]